jgi:N-acyl-D-amino-acid deacylase
MFDLVIRNGTLLDGTGAPAFPADLAISGGRVAAIGDLAAAEARATLDATGHCVTPGFIDAHSHSDAYLLIEPTAASKVYQGVTTEIVGNCGASAAPLLGPARMASDWQAHTYPGAWRTVAEYRRLIEQVRPAVNLVPLIGHNVLRASVMGYEGRAATPDEVAAMAGLLDQSLAEGGRGLSTGLIYPPGLYAAPDELRALARVVRRRNGLYATHMRSESSHLLEALEETLALGRDTGVRLQVSHLKTSGEANWGLLDRALDLLQQAREAGQAVAADRYPYIASCTELDVIFPAWATEGGREAELARLKDPATRARLRAEILAARSERSWGAIIIGSTTEPNAGFRGMPLGQVARILDLDPVDAALHLIESDGLTTSAFFQGMSEDNLWRILAQPWVMLGSDASLRAPWGPLSHDYPHPRAYGTFPRFLRAVLDGRSVPLPEAIRKLTSLPATHFNLPGRGLLKPGAHADVVVFDPATIRDRASYDNPHHLSEGIAAVIVNGVVTLKAGQLAPERAGQWL